MTTVYDIVEVLRKAKGFSIRKLADAAGIAPSTLESILTKRSQGISVLRLQQIASAFGLEWTDLFETGRETQVTQGEKPKVNSYIKEEEQKGILLRAFQKAHLNPPVHMAEEQESECSVEEHYRQVARSMIDRLNVVGLEEAVYALAAIAKNPDNKK